MKEGIKGEVFPALSVAGGAGESDLLALIFVFAAEIVFGSL